MYAKIKFLKTTPQRKGKKINKTEGQRTQTEINKRTDIFNTQVTFPCK